MAWEPEGFKDLMFRALDDNEEREFREFAQQNGPEEISEWDLYHPVLREEWLKRGIKPPGYEIVLDYGVKMRVEVTGAGGGAIESNLRRATGFSRCFCRIVESLVLAHTCAGVDVACDSYRTGLNTLLESESNK